MPQGKTSGVSKLGVGQTLVTDGRSKANVSIADIGTVNVEPNTRLRLIAGGNGHNRLALDRGTIHAYIWALPGVFTVDTPSATAVDLGCSLHSASGRFRRRASPNETRLGRF